uniref:Eukaryotic translation elongation factor 1 beta 2 n=1 Tax=Stegastes partitus TaxID=144197 RepID=A0A3B4ZFB3_9TELE
MLLQVFHLQCTNTSTVYVPLQYFELLHVLYVLLQVLHTAAVDTLFLGFLPGVKKPLGQYGPAGVADTTSGSAPAAKDDDDDDDIDLFGSDDEEDAEAARLKEERLAEYAAKKAKKPTLIAKSSILLDVKPWDDETDMAKLEECVRSIQMDGLVWGQSKLVPVGYGIKKLQIGCVVEDDKVGTDILEEHITAFEDFVQSMDVAAFNKI